MRTRKSLVAFLALLVAIAGIVVSGLGTTAAGAASIRNAGVIPSAGCGTSTVRGGETTVSTSSGGVQRDYIRHVPPAHDGVSPRPLVLSIHGLAEGPVIHAATTKWADRADEFGFVVAFPRGIDSRWSLGAGSADVVFLTQLLDELESQLCIDTNRVYMEGYSLGALMTSRLSCTLADRLAAVAPLAGAYAVSGCAPSKPVPLLTFHGTLDTFIPYEPIPGQVADWATRNGCTGPAAATDVPGDAVVTITKFTYPCPAGAEVQFYSIENGGHSWLGSEFSRSIESVIGYTTFAINATDLMWQFFRQHQVHPDVATYTARFTAAQGAMLARIAAARGESVADVVRSGVNGFRALAAAGLATTGPAPANDGPYWVTVRWPLDDAGAIDAAAAKFGVTGDQLHNAGGRLVSLIVYLAAIGRL